jgi:hypothetical protein
MAIAFPFSTLCGEGGRRPDEVFLHLPFLPCAERAGEYPKGVQTGDIGNTRSET